jgi:hypothetical protein
MSEDQDLAYSASTYRERAPHIHQRGGLDVLHTEVPARERWVEERQ